MRRNPEDLIEDIRSYMAANFFNEPLTGILEEAANTIEILLHERTEEDEEDIFTNGDAVDKIIEYIFDNDEDLGFVFIRNGREEGTMAITFDKEWWNAEYDPKKWGWRPEA